MVIGWLIGVGWALQADFAGGTADTAVVFTDCHVKEHQHIAIPFELCRRALVDQSRLWKPGLEALTASRPLLLGERPSIRKQLGVSVSSTRHRELLS